MCWHKRSRRRNANRCRKAHYFFDRCINTALQKRERRKPTLAIAAKHQPECAKSFLLELNYEQEVKGRKRRMRAIAEPRNLERAAAELSAAWADFQRVMQDVRPNFDPQLVWVAKAENLGERLLRIADLILPEKRKEIE